MRCAPLVLLAAVSCGGDASQPGGGQAPPEPAPKARPVDDPDPPTGRRGQAETFRADQLAPRHPGDGGGSVRLESGEQAVPCGSSGTWTVVLTVGPEGIAEGGSVRFMPDPFWNWSQPQTLRDEWPGYTTVTTDAEGVELELVDQSTGRGGSGSVIAIVGGAALEEGDQVRVVYGAGPAGARADRYAERGARLWLMVDADGDEVAKVVEDSPTVTVTHGPVSRLALHGPSVAREGEQVVFRAALLDEMANVVEDTELELRVTQRPEGWDLPETLLVRAEDRGAVRFAGTARSGGIARLAVEAEVDGVPLRAEANPLAVAPSVARIRWADLHGHSQLSDGTGRPDDWWRYARDVAGLDAAALTDHDHFGVRFVDERPALWESLKAVAREVHAPGEFVALLGFEWTNWIHGHRHVLYFGDDGALLSSLDPQHDDPRKLWSALEGQPALTVAHHSAGEPVPVNWTFRPPELLEPVTEIVSVHGSNESLDTPSPVRGALDGNTVRDQLDEGMRLGFIGSGDGHDGHPGLAHLSPAYGYRRGRVGTGGLAAILTEDLSREGLLQALRARRCYATSGPRILLDASLGGAPVGAALPAEGGSRALRVLLIGTGPLKNLDLVFGDRIERVELDGSRRFQAQLQVDPAAAAGYLYLRVMQEDGGMAWSSPWFFDG